MEKYNPDIHHRKSIRLKGYDYSRAGLYFITICCHERAHLFGDIIFSDNHSSTMILNDAGKIAMACWLEIPKHFPNVILHEMVVMPNHIHGIIELTDDVPVGANNYSPKNDISPHQFSHDNNDETNVGANDETNVGANDETNVGANDETNVGANDETNVGANDETNVGANDETNVGAKNFSPLHTTPFASPSKTIGSVVRGYKIGVTKWIRQNTDVETVWQRNYYENIIRNEQSYEKISDYIVNNPAKWKEDQFY